VLNFTSKTKIFAYIPAADMRRGFAGLCGLIRGELNADPTDGSLFLFVNKRRDRMKILHFTEGGFWMYYRLLEAGTFEKLQPKHENSRQLLLDATELTMLLAGVTLASSEKRRKRYAI
jgi:transposase